MTAHAVRPYLWSVRKELWEHRSLYIAPLAAAGVVLFGFLISAANFPHFRNAVLSLRPEQRAAAIGAIPYFIAAVAVLGTGVVTGALYCMIALHNERRDRTILFWKSLPVSDLVTVLAKASIPLAVLPVIVLAVTLVLQVVMAAIGGGVMLANGLGEPAGLQLLPRLTVLLAWSVVVMALWWAPVWSWLLLVSAWARRTPFLWAVLPPVALAILEQIAFSTHHVGALVAYRLHIPESAFIIHHSMGRDMHELPTPDPAAFLANLDLWTGLAVAAALLAGTVWVRRYREPI